ncbi:MAG: hypothetical protein KYX62_01430 [Pseudomonadota bacterium]|nr:hypothetical protein [Pseudomonadota bacterium]
MFTLTHEGDVIGTSRLERGDPAVFSVSGIFNNVGGPETLAAWMRSINGKEEDNIVYIDLQAPFKLVDAYGDTLTFSAGTLIAIPDEEEAFLDIEGLTEEDYRTHFRRHLAEL